MTRKEAAVVACAAVTMLAFAAGAAALGFDYGPWTAARSAEQPGGSAALNTSALEGCPSVARDDTRLFFASSRAGGSGGLDIWVAERASADDAWGTPVNVGPPVNSSGNEFCPTPTRDGHGLMFVSTRAGGCGGSDIYATREHPKRGWATPVNLGCGVNSAADEASPFLVPDEGTLYFSSTRAGGYAPDAPGAVSGDSDIYRVAIADGAAAGAPELVPGLNTAANDSRPNVRRDGLEIFFDSNRAGTLGGPDIWSATRASTDDAWSTPFDLGPLVNSAAADTRPSLSWDATTLYFGSTRPGGEGDSDLYVTTRTRAG